MGTRTDDTLVWSGLLTLLLLAPLPSGSITPLAQALLTLGVFTLLGLWIIQAEVLSITSPGVTGRRLWFLLLLWTLAVAFTFFQALPLPPKLVAVFSQALYDLYGWTLPNYSEGGIWRALSTTPGTTAQSGLLSGACAATFFLATRLCNTRERILVLALTVILVGAGEAIYGLTQVGGSLSRPASGTFVNRNHFAALLALALCVCVGLLLSRWEEGQTEGQAQADVPAAPRLGLRLDRWARTSPLVVLCVTILAGIIFSFSRMGLSAPIVMLVLFGVLWLLGPVSRRIRLIGMGIGTVAILLVAGAWPAFEVVAARFESLKDPYRVAAIKGSFDLFQSSPLVGIGLGGLVDNLPRFLPTGVQGIFDHSHNEPLELLAEGGVVYVSLFAMGLILYFGTLIPAWYKRRDHLARGLGLGCLAGTAAVLVHSLVDFPLRMPANAIALSIVMGLGWVSIHHRIGSNSAESPGSCGHGLPRSRVTRSMVLMVAATCIGLSGMAGLAGLFDHVGDGFVGRATRLTGEPRQALLGQAVSWYERARQIEPWQPAHTVRLGRAYELSAATLLPLSEETQALWTSAARAYGRAVRLHPANARLHAALAWAALQSGDVVAGRHAAQAALKLSPDDPEVRFAISKWYLAQWEALDEADRSFTTALVRQEARDLSGRYVDATWQLVREPTFVRQILPTDLPVRHVLLKGLTERQLFVERWDEQATYPGLRSRPPENGIHILSRGQMAGRQQPPAAADSIGPWRGMVEGWLSGGLTAKVNLVLPPGEAVLYIPIRGQAAGGVWPTLNMRVGGKQVPLPAISEAGWRTDFILVSSQGGEFLLQAILTNGAVILEDGEFIERRAALGPVGILAPINHGGFSGPPSGE